VGQLTFGEAIKEIQAATGNESNDFKLIIKRVYNRKRRLVAKQHKATAQQSSYTLSLAAGQSSYDLSSAVAFVERGYGADGRLIEAMDEAVLADKVRSVRVFARVSPEHKVRIVSALKRNGNVVSMTGDGVNDALALKKANVGVAMGITGTDVAKEAAEMIITDDNYATIVSAVEEGRIIYQNMKASIKYLVGSNIGEILSLLIGTLLGWPFILLPIQILYINLVTDGLPALALALNSKHHNIMRHSPRTETELFTKFDIRWLIEVSVLTAATTLVAFWIGWREDNLPLARTLAFIVIALAQQLIFLDIIGADRSILSRYVLKNKWALVPVGTVAVQLVLIHIHWFQVIFTTVAPHWLPLAVSAAICGAMILISEARKRFLRHLFYDGR